MDGTISAPLTRRGFLAGGAGIAFAIGATGLIGACTEREGGAPAMLEPNIWVRIATDGTVTIQFPATEMGQGSMTALPMILAEELDADWSKVRVETVAVHDTRYGNPLFGNLLYTAGSGAVQGYYTILRKAGAQARLMLMQSASDQLKIPLAQLSTEPGHVVHGASGRRIPYGEIAGFSQVSLTVPEIGEEDLKSPADFRLIGHDVPRLDIPGKVDGSALYGIDVQLPGMVHAALLRAPVEGESPAAVEGEEAARAVAGVTDIVRLDDAVAVVGERIEAVLAARRLLEVTWSGDSPFRGADSEATIADCLERVRALDDEGVRWREEGDARATLASAERVIEAEYTSGYAYHAQMEPLNATASVSADGKSAEIWVGTQTQSLTVLGAAQALGTTPDRIVLHPLLLGGGFGRRSFFRQRYVDDALFLSKAVGKPVKLLWTREDDVAFGAFRPATAQLLRAALDGEGRVVAWHHRVAAPSVIANMNPARWAQSGPKDVVTMNGADSPNYSVPHFLTEHVMTERRARLCAWRAVGTSYTKFASESFVDEIAEATGRDPLELRLELCREHPRAQAVLRRVAGMAGWGVAREQGRALGMALANYKPGSVSAGIAEISVDRGSGRIRVHKFWLAADPGTVIVPDNTMAQLEGNIVFGLSASLHEDITVADGRVEQSNFHDYPLLRMAELPEVEIDLMPDGSPPAAVGELGLATVPGAIANAFAVLTGKRLRRLAFTPDRVLETLAG